MASFLISQGVGRGNQRLKNMMEESRRDNSPLGPFSFLQKLADAAVISINSIRLRDKNSDTGMLTCAAVARFQVTEVEYDVTLEIIFTVENSSDGEYVTVYGLK